MSETLVPFGKRLFKVLFGNEWRFTAYILGATAALCALCALPAAAQLAGKGAISGTIADKTGAVIPGATIAATNQSTGLTTSTSSTGAGDFTFANLNPGTYTVTTEAKGFEKLVQKNLHVNALETTVYNPTLTVGGANEEITVTAEPPQLETTNATLGATMENETYSELPIEMGAYGQADQRRATDFVYLMPGVQGNETNGNATTNTGVVNGSGSRGAASDVYVDGVPFVRAGGNGDPRYVWTAISVDAVDQFQVQTTGYSALYEGQGVMNYTIKHGGDRQHGSVYEFFRNTALDSWGWFGKIPNPATGVPVKPVEHSNEYGINLGGPLIPFGSWRHKVFYFGNYNGFRYSSATPTPMTFATTAEQQGDFSAAGIAIYDPLSQATCTANSTDGPCRYQYGYGPGTGTGPAGNPVLTGTDADVNVIPQSEFSAVAQNLQQFLPAVGGTTLQNNYVSPNATGLVNWSTTDRIDYSMNQNDTFSFLAAIGRQASSVPVGQTTSGRNVGPVPYNYGQAYAPKTAVGIIEETHVFSPNLLNQVKWGYARYDGPTFSPNAAPAYASSAMGLSGLPDGQANGSFPIVTFSGADAPTNWGGTTENRTEAANFTLLDSVQWNTGKHSFTFGGQIAWMQYNVISATGGSTPITLANSVTETAGINASSNSSPKYIATPGTGLAYASFLLGEIDKGSFTQYLQQEFGARFRAISGYVQDNWKISPKLTADLGLRYDFYPTVTEQHNAESYFDPSLANPVTGINGALQFAGSGTGTCNCSTPVDNYHKNLGPRIGLAYQLGSKTVIRASYGVMFTHGNAVGGLNTSLGTLGFSAAPSFSSNGSLLSTIPLTGTNGAVPSFATAKGVTSGPAYGTGYTTTSGYTGTPSSMGYDDPYLGGRAPEYINWNFGLQHQLANKITLEADYVGSEGHFVQSDSLTARGHWSNQLEPKYLSLGSALADKGSALATDCVTYSLPCPSGFTASQPLSTALKPFPFHTVSDNFGYVANTNYHALVLLLGIRTWHGFTLNSNYTWSRTIDDGGTFRTGYAIPAGTLANEPDKSFPADRIERSVSTTNQPQHFVLTTVWALPIGKTYFASNATERAILGGFRLSGVYQAYSGSPLAITASSCQTNPAQGTCNPTINPNFSGSARQNGKWGHGVTWDTYNKISFIVPSVGGVDSSGNVLTPVSGPFIAPVPPSGEKSLLNTSYAPAYTFGNAPRTAPYNLYGPGNYQLDLALVRSFPLHFTESAKLDFRAEWYNVTNHTLFGVASTQVGNASFGQVTNSSQASRKAAQFSARISF
ncbi:MAG TPA: carboxypeptidase regulatory-like domain-containing protein [Terracidiphilus sp.]|nr:carboxypeptidase regulatory-like domain-containing protein [Terracidiphilus sp.]